MKLNEEIKSQYEENSSPFTNPWTQHSQKQILRSNYIRCNSGPMCWSGMGSSQLNLCATFTCRHLNSYFYVGFEPLSHSFQLIILTMNYELTFSTKTDAMRRAVMQFCNTFDHNSWWMGLLNMQFDSGKHQFFVYISINMCA